MIGLKRFATFRYWSAKPPFLRSQHAGRKFGFEEAIYSCTGSYRWQGSTHNSFL